jgi:hypothetical protein
MIDLDYSALSFGQRGHVRFNGQALRLATFAGQHLLALGTPGAVKFFDAETLIRALHGNANIFDSPLPEPVPVLILDEFDADEQTLIRSFLLGDKPQGIETQERKQQAALVFARAASLGLVLEGADWVRLLEEKVRTKTQAELQNRVLAEKAADLGQGFMVKPADESKAIELGVVRRCDPATYERIVRGTGGYRPAAARIRWPFNTMRVGDEIFIDAKLARKAQTAAHVYAARANWTFRTSLNRVTGVLQVIRTEDRPGTIPQRAKGERDGD